GRIIYPPGPGCVVLDAPVVVQGAYAMRPYMHSANSTAPVGADYISARTRLRCPRRPGGCPGRIRDGLARVCRGAKNPPGGCPGDDVREGLVGQHAVQDHGHFSTGDVALGLDLAIGADDNAVADQVLDGGPGV